MARRNLFEKLNHPSTSKPLRPFDLSQRKIYSSRAGVCLPELALTVYKGEKYKIDTTVFNRTEKLLAPAYFRCKQFHHFYFVPFHTLWHEWDSFFTRSTEKLSAATYDANYWPNFDLFDYINKVKSGSVPSDMMGYSGKPGIDRMLQMTGNSSLAILDNLANPSISGKYVNLAKPLAYNKIWYWYYRDKRHFAANNYTSNAVKLYNVDDIDTSTIANSHIDLSNSVNLNRINDIMQVKYRTWDSDVFTNSFADTQFGSVSVLNTERVQIQSHRSGNFPAGTSPSDYEVNLQENSQGTAYIGLKNTNSGSTLLNGSYWNIPNLFDILQLRRAQAVQHWRELMLRAGDSSKDRYVAMFGSHPKRSEEAPIYIGGFDANLNIDDVTATGYDSSQQAGDNKGLGDLAGKGIMSANGHIEFVAPDAGILMCISSILPLAEYDATQIDKDNTCIEPNDFFIPQYDNLGFEPVMKYEQIITGTDISSGFVDTVIGYTVRNHHLKTAVDRIFNNFRTGKSEAYWCCPRRDVLTSNPNINYNLNYRNYYVNPSVVNPLFDRHCLTNTSDPDNSYNEDQFKCLTYFDIKALKPMTELGLPPL